jgi:hypothetical protein
MTYSTYDQKEKLGQVKNRKYTVDIDALTNANSSRGSQEEAVAAGVAAMPLASPQEDAQEAPPADSVERAE